MIPLSPVFTGDASTSASIRNSSQVQTNITQICARISASTRNRRIVVLALVLALMLALVLMLVSGRFHREITSLVFVSLVKTRLNALTAVGALMTLIDFTLSNARRFYSSMGNPSVEKRLR